MKRSPKSIRLGARAAASLTFIFLVGAGLAAALDEPPVPQKNLASAESGAQIECTTPDGRLIAVPNGNGANKNATAFLTDEETLNCPLQEGQTTFVIKLPATSLLDRFTFVNENAAAAGEMKISVSNYQLPAASPKWVDVDGAVTFSHKRLFNLSMVGVEARYMRLAFNVAKSGRLAAVGVYGASTASRTAGRSTANQQFGWISNVNPSAPSKKYARNFDYAALHAKARVIFVSSNDGPATARMIDGNEETGFRFAASDARPTAIVELAPNERINRVTARYQMQGPGRVDVYLLDDMSKSATDINYRQPIASATEQNENGEAAVDFDPQGARYVALRFTSTDPAAAGSGLEITEIHAYGDVPMALLDSLEAPDVYASNSAGTVFPGESTQEISSSLGTLAVPPTIPAISP